MSSLSTKTTSELCRMYADAQSTAEATQRMAQSTMDDIMDELYTRDQNASYAFLRSKMADPFTLPKSYFVKDDEPSGRRGRQQQG